MKKISSVFKEVDGMTATEAAREFSKDAVPRRIRLFEKYADVYGRFVKPTDSRHKKEVYSFMLDYSSMMLGEGSKV